MLLRVAVTAAAALLTAFAYQRTKTFSVWIGLFLVIAAVFNPIVPLHLTRGAWSIENTAAGALFVGQFVVDRHRGNRKMEFVLKLNERVSATSTRRRAFEAKRDRLVHEPTLPLNKADREVIMLALSEWIFFTHAIAFDPDEKGYTRQEITRMRNNIVKVKSCSPGCERLRRRG
jgi:hypothetical protein